jgi:hypothetical protein
MNAMAIIPTINLMFRQFCFIDIAEYSMGIDAEFTTIVSRTYGGKERLPHAFLRFASDIVKPSHRHRPLAADTGYG